MASSLPPHLVLTWLPIRDVASALRVSKEWCGASEPLFQAIAGRHGLQRVEPSWRVTVGHFRSSLGQRFVQELNFLVGAAQRNDVPTIQRYISEGADVNLATSAGQTPLHIAAMWGNLDVLNALIAAGADLNAQNGIERTENGGGTPLHSAANSTKATLSMRYVCARRLIEAGANARLLNGEEAAPYESPFPEHESDVRNYDLADIRVRFRKLLKFAFRAHRCLA